MARTSETPRDLLFGLLALQNGLIDPDQLVASFGTWTRSKDRALAEILVERGAIDEPGRLALAAMAEVQLRKHAGDAETSLASLSVGPSIRRKLAELGQADLTASLTHLRVQGPSSSDSPTLSIGTATGEGGRFRILRPHAQGGLGAVFVALDRELNREVALKQILDHRADDALSRTRFLIEAEITGGLEHPGIVPVYGLGRHGDGRPYYAMRFIRGDSLKEAIEAFHRDGTLKSDPGRRSLALRKLLRRFTDVCNAIEYAHTRGVLHRDIKPGNVIVGRHGETLVVDWGLAKPMGHAEPSALDGERTLRPSSTSGEAETLHGQAIGTPAYMSPEQAAGDLDRLGPRSDVYSLGATLYSLLTGRSPFEGTILGEVLRDVRKGAFEPPRQLDPSIDRALEAVCLKAMATDPDDRHATARALAEDIERWAADEPVSAWREPASVRARRWMRRHRSTVTAASAALLVAVVGLASVLAVQARANSRLEAKNAELDGANRRLRDRFDLAREAIGSIQSSVQDDVLLRGRELKGVRDRLLRSAASFYEKLEKQLENQADRASREILARSYFELGELTDRIGTKPEALVLHRKALAIRRELVASPGADAGAKLDLARSLIATASMARAIGVSKPDRGLSEFLEARGLVEPLAVSRSATNDARDLLATCLIHCGWILDNQGKSDESQEHGRQALAIYRKLAEDNPTVPEYRSRVADCLNNIGDLASYHEALAILRKLAAENPSVISFRENLANILSNLGVTTGEPDPFHEAVAIRRELVEQNPAMTTFRDDLGWSLSGLADLQWKAGQSAEALESTRKAVEIHRRLVEDDPRTLNFRMGLGRSLLHLGTLLQKAGQTAEALAATGEAVRIFRKLVEDDPDTTSSRWFLMESLRAIGGQQVKAGRVAEAISAKREAAAMCLKLAEDSPGVPGYRDMLADYHRELAGILTLSGDLAGAVDEYRRAIAVLEKVAPTADGLYNLACYRSLLAGVAARPGSRISGDEAAALGFEAISALGRAIDAGYRDHAHMRADSDLDPLRGRADFRLLMLDLAFPADPFSR